MDRRANKYFLQYAEKGLSEITESLAHGWTPCDVVVAIPLREEEDTALERLLKSLVSSAAAANARLLIIFVVNARLDDSADVHKNNARTLAWFHCLKLKHFQPDVLVRHEKGYSILVVDRASEAWRLPCRQGVGLARKIGNDLAAMLIKTGRVRHRVFGNTDGDASVPLDYVARLTSLDPRQAGAWIYPFLHVDGADTIVNEQTSLYENYLRYYATQLSAAGSPYGFVSLGSVICMDVERYIAVRGHPKRLAGEDFYILNKIRKIAPVISLGGDPIQLTARISDRVPFGTGQAVAAMAKRPSNEPYLVYDPRSFVALRTFLKHCVDAALRGDTTAPERIFEGSELGIEERVFCEILGLKQLWLKIHHPEPFERVNRFHAIFDGLRTLQFVHVLRDLVFLPVPVDQALAEAQIAEPLAISTNYQEKQF